MARLSAFAGRPQALAMIAAVLGPTVCLAAAPTARLNIVLIVADDLGYGDLGCYGNAAAVTPNLDRLAEGGIRLTNFYAAQATCTSSRAAILTGCYPNRIGVVGALNHTATTGINPDETTLAEVLRARGYRTGIIGKWHLGHRPQFSPLRHGFEVFFGLPYSHDMWPSNRAAPKNFFPDLPLMDGVAVVEKNPDPRRLTSRYTRRAVQFITDHVAEPFFLYLAHNLPHVPLGSMRKRPAGRSLYQQVVTEIDESVGEVRSALRRFGLEDQTLIVFTSDNGPWLLYGDHGGVTGGLREGKATSFEGGVRVPCIVSWPGRIAPRRTSDEPAMNIDLLPTLAAIAGATPGPRGVDGIDLSNLLLADKRPAPRPLYFYFLDRLHGVRFGRWKLELPHTFPHVKTPGQRGSPGTYETRRIELSLFDLERDPAQEKDVAQQHPDVVKQLTEMAEAARADLGDSLTAKRGTGIRPPDDVGNAK